LTHHNVESQLAPSRRAGADAARWFLQREAIKLRDYEVEVSPRYDVNIFMSVPDRDLLMDHVGGIRAAVVPNGVDVEYFAPDGSGGMETSLIYTGGMNMFANRDAVMSFLSEVWPAVRAAVPGVRFYAVGQDPPRELTTLTERDPGIVVTGYVDDIRPLVRKAAVYVVPLRVGGGTRLKVLDAMASGKAIVSTSIGCEGIDVVPGRHLLVADTPEAFAQTTVELLQDEARRVTLGRAARALVQEKYAWPVVGGQLMDAYREAIAHHARSHDCRDEAKGAAHPCGSKRSALVVAARQPRGPRLSAARAHPAARSHQAGQPAQPRFRAAGLQGHEDAAAGQARRIRVRLHLRERLADFAHRQLADRADVPAPATRDPAVHHAREDPGSEVPPEVRFHALVLSFGPLVCLLVTSEAEYYTQCSGGPARSLVPFHTDPAFPPNEARRILCRRGRPTFRDYPTLPSRPRRPRPSADDRGGPQRSGANPAAVRCHRNTTFRSRS
jgi:hypothetical protein